ncbi:hypothetical protein NCCP691_10990 [Noviherbaspirillum aridicola]|uniref:Uncharacterized protein n=2 Tax=Noviherbaspirillum aridicola TaxID=2849687 RepID=A0ABQ4Q2Q5_9BURK|nr:hypothetical protein NCCP691_10990 [Noviherbaspirillum aridicola]
MHFNLARTGPKRVRTSYGEAKRRRLQEQEAEQISLEEWLGEQQAQKKAEEVAQLLAQLSGDDNENIDEWREEEACRLALWELTKDAVNTVWKIGRASDVPAVKGAAQILVQRFNALVERGRPVAGRMRRIRT